MDSLHLNSIISINIKLTYNIIYIYLLYIIQRIYKQYQTYNAEKF